MIQSSQDADHEGLKTPAEVPENDPPPMRRGRSLRRKDAFGPYHDEYNIFDRDVGASRSSSLDEEGVL